DAMFWASSSAFSSNEMQRPGSLYSNAPHSKYFMANSVFPDPGPPHTSVFLPVGIPPVVISSRPGVPVGVFLTNSCSCRTFLASLLRGLPSFFIFVLLAHRLHLEGRNRMSCTSCGAWFSDLHAACSQLFVLGAHYLQERKMLNGAEKVV